MLCSEPIQRIPQRGAAEGRPPLWWRPKAATFVLALNKAHVLALNTAHVLRLNKADVLRLNNKICPVFRANTKETTKGGGRRPPPFVEAAEGRLLCVGCEHWAYLSVETQDMCLVESQDICLVETQDMCCVES